MAKFDPNQHAPKEGTGKRGDVLQIGGLFLIAFIKILERDETKNGTPFVKMFAKVVGTADRGPPNRVGDVFFPKLFLGPGSYSRLAAMCSAMGQTGAFDLDNDQAVARAICFRPFKAKLAAQQWTDNHGNKRVDIDLKFSEPSMSRDERDQCDAWLAEQEADREARGQSAPGSSDSFDDAPPPDDDDFAGDDIPF